MRYKCIQLKFALGCMRYLQFAILDSGNGAIMSLMHMTVGFKYAVMFGSLSKGLISAEK